MKIWVVQNKSPIHCPVENVHAKMNTKSVVDFGRKFHNEDDKISKNEGDFQIQQYTAESENDLQTNWNCIGQKI